MCNLSQVIDCKGVCTNGFVTSQVNYHMAQLGGNRDANTLAKSMYGYSHWIPGQTVKSQVCSD